ncbi:DUF3606 domain-containing protein [Chitinophaga pinensis]|uniref:DUF3606 domain-containing protein n=1 Tax=Chitinophaga pinensis (strain ATCC 43595 / DSM 2588 / LMG 13176 / NBRC 15968 / NCIMB 11800 / UQM 2034) TaxID=485918 RepID=A0A979G4Z0_CHIPD|nr:DUF3606 domain-containing protein [Chitinophaga pinensis]ACU60924.1 hypothetical protein Cpin_3457 [Chitinophaga pinensis DSM 2588]
MEKYELQGDGGNNGEHQQTFVIADLAEELGVSTQEVLAAVEIVGDDPVRVREFVRRNHTEIDDTNEV